MNYSRIYIIREENTEYFKVGVSKNRLSNRLIEMQVGNPRKLYIYRYFYVPSEEVYKLEKRCHAALSNIHVRGEWFKSDDIDNAILIMANIVGSLPREYHGTIHGTNRHIIPEDEWDKEILIPKE